MSNKMALRKIKVVIEIKVNASMFIDEDTLKTDFNNSYTQFFEWFSELEGWPSVWGMLYDATIGQPKISFATASRDALESTETLSNELLRRSSIERSMHLAKSLRELVEESEMLLEQIKQIEV